MVQTMRLALGLTLGGGLAVAALWLARRARRRRLGAQSTNRVLVTGGAGFVLANFVHDWLSTDTTATAVIFDRPQAWDQTVHAHLQTFIDEERLAFFDGDCCDSSSFARLSVEHGQNFAFVVSGAALTPTLAEERERAFRVLDVNFGGLLRTLEWAGSLPKLRRFIHISSDAVLSVPGLLGTGAAASPGAKQHVVPAMSSYALSKVAGEAALKNLSAHFKVDAVSVRFSDVWGHLDRDTGARNRHNAPFWCCRHVVDQSEGPLQIAAASLEDVGWVRHVPNPLNRKLVPVHA